MVFNLSLNKVIGRTLSPFIPKSVGSYPYLVALSTVEQFAIKIFSRENCQLWARNSFITDSFKPLISDLDITVLLREPPSSEQLARFKQILRKIRLFFPPLGECNFYIESQAKRLSRWANPWEIQRDPRLFSWLSAVPAEISPSAYKCVFILRMLENDLENLYRTPKLRQNKWISHLQAVEAPIPDWTNSTTIISGIIRSSLALAQLESDQAVSLAQKDIEAYFKHQIATGKNPWIPPKKSPSACVFFPHRFCHRPLSLKITTQAQGNIVLAQIAWEAWGLASQYLLNSDKENMSIYLQNLHKSLHTFLKPAFLNFKGPEGKLAKTLIEDLIYLESLLRL